MPLGSIEIAFIMASIGDFASLLYNTSVNCSNPNLTNEDNCNATTPHDNIFLGPPAVILEFSKILYALVGIVGLVGNTLVIYVVLRFSKMQTVTNMYILNLAVADEMFLIGLPFLLITMICESWPFGSAMCKVYMTTTSINQFTGSLLLTVMSADRYVAVCHPIQSPRYRTTYIAKFICLTAWALSALLMVPIYMYASILTTPDGQYVSCNIYWPENAYMNGEMAFTLYAFTLGFAVPLVLILVFYFLVICKLKTVGPKKKSKEKKRTHRKVTYLVLTVVTVYVICWLPYWSAQIWLTFIPPDMGQNNFSFSMMLLTGCLSYANSAMNPILYAFLSDNFKKSFAKAFTCAAIREINAQLQVENSVFPKNTKNSSTRTGDRRQGESSNQNLRVRQDDPEQSTAVTMVKSENQGFIRNGVSKAPTEDGEEVTQV